MFISFIWLLPSCVFLLSQVSFAFGPSLLSYLFRCFSSSSPSILHLLLFFLLILLSLLFILPPRSVVVSCVYLPISSFHATFFSLLLLFPSIFLHLGYHYYFLPPSLLCFSSSFFDFLLLFFSSFAFSTLYSLPLSLLFLILLFSLCLYFSSSFFLWILHYFLSSFFLLYRQFLHFFLWSFYRLFLRLTFSLSPLPPLFFSYSSLSTLGFLSLSVLSCSFFRFPFFFFFFFFCLFLCSRAIWSRFLFSFSIFVVSIFLRSVIRFSYLSASPFLSRLPLLFLYSLYSSAVCIISSSVVCWRFVFSGLSLLRPPPPPLPPLVAFEISSLFFSSGLPPVHFFVSFLLPSLLLLPVFSLSLSLSTSCVFSPSWVTLLYSVASHIWFTFVVVFCSYAPASFSMRQNRGCLRRCSFSVTQQGDTPLFVPSTLRGICCLFFRFAFGVSLPFGL